jgi:hypothetical protein
MPPRLFAHFLQVAGWSFAVGAMLVQIAAFRALRRPRQDALRRFLLFTLLRAAPLGILSALLAFAIWVPGVWPAIQWEALVSLEILLGLVLVELGLAAVAMRASLSVLIRLPVGRERWPLLMIRLGVLSVGWIYAWALATRMARGPGETLMAVALLGAALLAVGLNRVGDISSDTVDRWLGK